MTRVLHLRTLLAAVAAFATLGTASFSDAQSVAPDAPAPIAVPYLRLGWRVMGLADHVSHGPEFALGAVLFDHLELGIAGFARPGPINRATFDVPLEGEPYRGQNTVSLRSDGALVGLMVGFRTHLGVDWLELEVPVMVGLGAFGFYLTDDDRETPDGRRVSEWEDELFDGRDAAGGIMIDAGLRLAVTTPLRWLKVSAGVQYSHLFGYDAFVTSDYSGFSGSLALEVVGLP